MDAVMPALPPPQPGFEIFIASHGMSQGLSQTEGVQVIPRAVVRIGRAQVGGQWRNIDSPIANGIAAVFVKAGGNIGRLRLDGGVAYRFRTAAKVPSHSEAWEFSAGAARSFGRFGLRVRAEY